MGNVIFYIVLAIITVVGMIVNGVQGDWLWFTISTVAFVMDTIDAVISFQDWEKNSKNKEKKGN